MKRKTSFERALQPRDSETAAYVWLYESLRAEILEGRMRPGTRLPGTRDFANQYSLSRGTIVRAFEQLKSEGYLEGRVGSGTYVSKILPEEWFQMRDHYPAEPTGLPKHRRRISDYARRLRLFPGYEPRPMRAFRANLPALDLFPTALWAQLANRRFKNASTFQLMGGSALGYMPLREAISDYLSASRGVKCVAEQIAVLSGAQEAIDLAARILLNTGDLVCMENPGYTGAVTVFEAIGAKMGPIDVDDEGMKIPAARFCSARLLYVTPGHQFPLGITMSLARRLKLLEWAQNVGALILEDDYDSEFRYSGRPVPALQGLDRNGQVLFAGSFSKVLFPSLRLGYLVIPRDLLSYFEAALAASTRHASLPEQAVLCDFMTAGHFGRHLRRMREIYAERLSVLQEESRARLQGLLDISDIQAGLQTVGWLRRGWTAERAAKAAAALNVEVTPLSSYHIGRPLREGLQLGFAALDPREICRGVRDLAIALEEKSRRRPW